MIVLRYVFQEDLLRRVLEKSQFRKKCASVKKMEIGTLRALTEIKIKIHSFVADSAGY